MNIDAEAIYAKVTAHPREFEMFKELIPEYYAPIDTADSNIAGQFEKGTDDYFVILVNEKEGRYCVNRLNMSMFEAEMGMRLLHEHGTLTICGHKVRAMTEEEALYYDMHPDIEPYDDLWGNLIVDEEDE